MQHRTRTSHSTASSGTDVEFTSATVVEIAVDLAVITFNGGHKALQGLLQRLKYGITPTIMQFLQSKDHVQVFEANYKGKELVKKRERQDSVALHEEQVAAEGNTYSPGEFVIFNRLCSKPLFNRLFQSHHLTRDSPS